MEGLDPSSLAKPSKAQPDGLFLCNMATEPGLQLVAWIESTGVMPMPVHHVNTAKKESFSIHAGGKQDNKRRGFCSIPSCSVGCWPWEGRLQAYLPAPGLGDEEMLSVTASLRGFNSQTQEV